MDSLIHAKEAAIKCIRAEIKRERPTCGDQESQAQYQYHSWSFDQLLDQLRQLVEEIATLRTAEAAETNIQSHAEAPKHEAPQTTTRHELRSLTQTCDNAAKSKSSRQTLDSKEMAAVHQTIQTPSVENSAKEAEIGAKPTDQTPSETFKLSDNPNTSVSESLESAYTISRKAVYAHLSGRSLSRSLELESEDAMIRVRKENREENTQRVFAKSTSQLPLEMLVDHHHLNLDASEGFYSKQKMNELVGAKLITSYETPLRISQQYDEPEIKLRICYETLLNPSSFTPEAGGEKDEFEVLYGSPKFTEECMGSLSSFIHQPDDQSGDPGLWKAQAQQCQAKSQRQRDDMDRLEKKLGAQSAVLKKSKNLESQLQKRSKISKTGLIDFTTP